MLPYIGVFSSPGRKDRALVINKISVKKQYEFQTEMIINGTLDAVPFTCHHTLMEGQACEGSVRVRGQYLMKNIEEELQIAILQLIDEHADAVMQAEMARICGELP